MKKFIKELDRTGYLRYTLCESSSQKLTVIYQLKKGYSLQRISQGTCWSSRFFLRLKDAKAAA